MLQHLNSDDRSLLNIQKVGEWAVIPAALILMLAIAAFITMAIA
jgi:hypothetical protein